MDLTFGSVMMGGRSVVSSAAECPTLTVHLKIFICRQQSPLHPSTQLEQDLSPPNHTQARITQGSPFPEQSPFDPDSAPQPGPIARRVEGKSTWVGGTS